MQADFAKNLLGLQFEMNRQMLGQFLSLVSYFQQIFHLSVSLISTGLDPLHICTPICIREFTSCSHTHNFAL
jgi:hypothetical protein